MALTDISIRNSKAKDKPYKLSDGAGLYLLVGTNGSKLWRLKYRIAGKEKTLSIGSYPLVTLGEAREKVMEAKSKLLNNIDPSQAKQEAKQKELALKENSFESVARCWHSNKKMGWTARHASYVLRRIEADLFPSLGFRNIDEISAPELLQVFRIIEKRGAIDIAHRAHQTCGQIFRYAVAIGKAQRDISSDLMGALKTRKKENYSRLEASELPDFLKKLEDYDGDTQTKIGLKLLILTFVRTGEARGAKWSKINFDKKEWRIPLERMKMK